MEQNRTASKGLGRVRRPDARDLSYPLAAVMQPMETAQRHYRHWRRSPWVGDQGPLPHCVGFGWMGFIMTAPKVHSSGILPYKPSTLYARAQQLDPYEGENYAGTTVRAGAQAAQEAGLIEGGYHWAFDSETVVKYLLTTGPVVLGTDWYGGMQYPDSKGRMDLKGELLGGHCYLATGVNLKSGFIDILNSHGKEYGINGTARLHINHLHYLMLKGGEACAAREVVKK